MIPMSLIELHEIGLENARLHYREMATYAKLILPEEIWADIPDSLEKVAGLFTASTREMMLTVFDNLPGYSAISMLLSYKPADNGWELDKFAVNVGTSFYRHEFYAYTMADAVVMSRRIEELRQKSMIDMGTSLADMPSSLVKM